MSNPKFCAQAGECRHKVDVAKGGRVYFAADRDPADPAKVDALLEFLSSKLGGEDLVKAEELVDAVLEDADDRTTPPAMDGIAAKVTRKLDLGSRSTVRQSLRHSRGVGMAMDQQSAGTKLAADAFPNMDRIGPPSNFGIPVRRGSIPGPVTKAKRLTEMFPNMGRLK